jgi:hypothetical protein
MRLGLAVLAFAGALTGVLFITWQGMAAIGLALSLLKRGRELILGAAALAAWHAVEGTALWRRMS